MLEQPILYSFRRCPYAIRARIALFLAGITYTLREVDLKNKPSHLLHVSPKGTVPVLITPLEIIDESMDIIQWAFEQSCPDALLLLNAKDRRKASHWCAEIAPKFIEHLNRIKYPSRYSYVNMDCHIKAVQAYLLSLNAMLHTQPFLFGYKPCFADISLYPFIRQLNIARRDILFATASNALKAWFNWWQDHPMQAQIMQKSNVYKEK